MSELIRKLAEQAGMEFDDDEYLEFGKQIYYVITEDVEKFAELIVRECCDVLYDNELGGYQVNYVLKEHFGVE